MQLEEWKRSGTNDLNGSRTLELVLACGGVAR